MPLHTYADTTLPVPTCAHTDPLLLTTSSNTPRRQTRLPQHHPEPLWNVPRNPHLQPWLERTQLDALRTNCYQPGPLHKVDLEDLKPNGANGTPVANGSAENGHAVTAAAEQPAQPAYDGLEKADTFGAHQPVAVAAA